MIKFKKREVYSTRNLKKESKKENLRKRGTDQSKFKFKNGQKI